MEALPAGWSDLLHTFSLSLAIPTLTIQARQSFYVYRASPALDLIPLLRPYRLYLCKCGVKPESKQLIIQYPTGEWQHLDNFEVYFDIPKEMVSGPFTAVFNRMALEISEVQNDNRTITILFLN